jgi:tRNA-splicing ligase RtcB
MKIMENIPVWGDHEEKTLAQIRTCAATADRVAAIVESVHNHHNFAWREEHDGEQYWVVRNGATPAFLVRKDSWVEPWRTGRHPRGHRERGVEACHVQHHPRCGTRDGTSRSNWSHRPEDRRSEARTEDTREMMDSKVTEASVELRGAGVDESPHCYKRLDQVLEAHSSTVRILHTLTPVGVAMAGANEFDPYKD